jgi:hypothetical protein
MYSEYIGLNEMERLFAVHGASALPPPPPPPVPVASPLPGLSEEQPSVLSPSVLEEMAARVKTRRVESAFMTYTFSSDSNGDGGTLVQTALFDRRLHRTKTPRRATASRTRLVEHAFDWLASRHFMMKYSDSLGANAARWDTTDARAFSFA